MEAVEKILALVLNVLVFALISVIFLPALLVVNTFQEVWANKLKDLFKY